VPVVAQTALPQEEKCVGAQNAHSAAQFATAEAHSDWAPADCSVVLTVDDWTLGEERPTNGGADAHHSSSCRMILRVPRKALPLRVAKIERRDRRRKRCFVRSGLVRLSHCEDVYV
jgi:hypothetical protein